MIHPRVLSATSMDMALLRGLNHCKKLQLLLPLALEDKKRMDVALVCNHVYKPEEGVNNYEGRTIFTLQMAYNNAILITRPDSDWLMADMAINK